MKDNIKTEIIKKSVQELSAYVVKQTNSIVKLNQNESPYDIEKELKTTILEKLNNIEWNRYPLGKPEKLIKLLSSYTEFEEDGIVLGNSSNEIIQSIILSICTPKIDKLLTITPGFSIYGRVAQISDIELIEVPLREDLSFDVQQIIEKSKDVKLIMLASPNNPTGSALSIEEVIEILENTKSCVVIDEAYFEFYQKTVKDFIKKYNRLIIIRTFSKAFGMAGLRLGYLLASKELAAEIEKAKLPFSVGIIQQITGETILEAEMGLIKTSSNMLSIKNKINLILEQRDKLFDELNKIKDIKPFRSETNFILFEVNSKKYTAEDIFNKLYEENGILIRYFGGKGILKNKLRVNAGTAKETDIFLNAIKSIF